MNKRTIILVVVAGGALLAIVLLMQSSAKAAEAAGNAGNAGGWTKAPASAYTTANLLQQAASVTDLGNNKLRLDLPAEVSRRLFGTSGPVFVKPSTTGVKFNAAPELVAKLQAKYGAGELFQKGKNLTDGFEWVTNTGTTQLSFKDFVTLSKS